MNLLDELQARLVTASAAETQAGKTTLVRGLARGLGITADVTSPTYTIYTLYQGRRQLLHMDAYRLGDAHELDSLSIDEFLKPPYLIVVEWPGHIPGFFEEYPTFCIQMRIQPDHDHQLVLVQTPR